MSMAALAALVSCRIMLAPAVALFALAAAPSIDQGDIRHSAEIEVFANSMAIARVAKTNCAGVVPDERRLDALRLRLHIAEADHAEFAFDAQRATALLMQRLANTPSREVWCNATLQLYGPEGTLVRGMLRR